MNNILKFATNQKRAEPDPCIGNAFMLNMWHDFFVKHDRADLARAVVAAGDLTPELHKEWLALTRADTRRNTHLSNITTY